MALDCNKQGEWQRHTLGTKSGFKSSVIKNYDMNKNLLEDLTSTYANSPALGDQWTFKTKFSTQYIDWAQHKNDHPV